MKEYVIRTGREHLSIKIQVRGRGFSFLQKEVVYQQKTCLMTSWRVGENDGVVIYTQIAGCWHVTDGGLWCRVYHFTPEVNVNSQIGVMVYF